jgi:hypothetical protein
MLRTVLDDTASSIPVQAVDGRFVPMTTTETQELKSQCAGSEVAQVLES